MADDLDVMLQGEDLAPGSQPENSDQSIDSTQSQTVEQQSPEEVEFNRLPGSARDRWKSLTDKLHEKDAELERLRSQPTGYVPPAPGTLSPQDKTALETLASAGVATDEKVDRKIGDALASVRYENEMNRLESRYAGSSNEPQFVREEYEEYLNSHPQYRNYLPEDVFKFKMFNNEFSNLDKQTGQPTTGRTSTLRPTRSNVQAETLTPEYIEERLKQPDGQDWYVANLDRINESISKMNA